MWCKHCGQDVPGVAREELGQFGCPRCSRTIAVELKAAHAVGLAESSDFGLDLSAKPAAASNSPAADLDDWRLAEDLRQLRRMLHVATDAPRPVTPSHVPQAPALQFVRPADAAPRAKRRRSVIAWMVCWLGLAACACGVGLLVWSWIDGRPELWSLGMPIALGGQFGLLCGLVMQLDRIWYDNSQTVEKLGRVDQRLHELKQTTLLHAPTNPTGAFYSHLAQGASPQLLLADLKGQLDLLAVRLSASA